MAMVFFFLAETSKSWSFSHGFFQTSQSHGLLLGHTLKAMVFFFLDFSKVPKVVIIFFMVFSKAPKAPKVVLFLFMVFFQNSMVVVFFFLAKTSKLWYYNGWPQPLKHTIAQRIKGSNWHGIVWNWPQTLLQHGGQVNFSHEHKTQRHFCGQPSK